MAQTGHIYYIPIKQIDTLANAVAGTQENLQQTDSSARANFLYIPPHFTIEHQSIEHGVIGEKTLDDLINEIKTIKPNPHKNSVEPISQVWPARVKTYTAVESFEKTYIPKKIDTLANLGLLLVILIFFIVAVERIADGGRALFVNSFNLKKIRELEGDTAMQTSRNLTLVFSILLLSFILANQNITYQFAGNIPVIECFAIFVLSVAAYLIIKSWVLYILDYVNDSHAFRMINKMGRTYLTLCIFCMLGGEAVFLIFQNISPEVIRIWMIISCVAPALLYLNMGRRVIFQNRFSIFTYILYLCTVEILPIVLIVKTI